jgi:hypothetical protein
VLHRQEFHKAGAPAVARTNRPTPDISSPMEDWMELSLKFSYYPKNLIMVGLTRV